MPRDPKHITFGSPVTFALVLVSVNIHTEFDKLSFTPFQRYDWLMHQNLQVLSSS